MTRICGFLKRLMPPAAAFLLCLEGIAPHAAFAAASDHFKIACVDEETGRGIPLVELRTVNNIKSFTDSNGLIAFNEPGLMGRKVFFHVQSHGYEFPKDGFGNRGVALTLKAGGSAVIKLHRVNIAERLYRVTGAGIYRDTVLLGEKPPTEQPVINGDVFGQDNVITAVFKNQVYWFWGDTDRPGYPLGNFSVSGATSQLPGKGGLDPKIGVNLHYFTNSDGFTRKMLLLEGPGLVWIGAVHGGYFVNP